MTMLTWVVDALRLSLIETFYIVGVFLTIGFLLGVMEKKSNSFLISAFGKRGILLTAWIGTPIHEIGHLLQCIIWRHKVKKIKLLQIDSPDGVLGYVQHAYNPKSIYQQIGNFFIGIGPIISGIGSLILAMYFLVPDAFATFASQVQHKQVLESMDSNVLASVGEAVLVLSKSLFTFENLSELAFWIFLLFAISVSSHIALSKADIQNSLHGVLIIFSVLALSNVVATVFGVKSDQMIVYLKVYNAYILAFSSIAVFFSVVTLGLSFLVYQLKKGYPYRN
jgi:hypothetical protein